MSRAIALFAKRPVPGRVKTRLTPPLTPEEGALVARASLEDTLRRFPSRVAAEWTLFLDGSDGALTALAAKAGVRVAPQGAGGLGERLARAFTRLRTEGADRVVAIGSDSPTLDPARIEAALDGLGERDVALGPAEDGGYYLIGTRAAVDASALFASIPWSTASVARVTEARARALGHSLARLPVWYDLDDPDSLRRAAADPALGECPALSRALARIEARLATSPS